MSKDYNTLLGSHQTWIETCAAGYILRMNYLSWGSEVPWHETIQLESSGEGLGCRDVESSSWNRAQRPNVGGYSATFEDDAFSLLFKAGVVPVGLSSEENVW